MQEPGVQEPQFAWTSAIVFILVVSGLSGGIAYWATIPAQPFHLDVNPIVKSAAAAAVPELPALLSSPTEESAQVRFTNPFDATEVFEFPSGTTETEAREAVSGILLQRAYDRQDIRREMRQRRKTASQVEPVTPASLARRS